MKVYNVRMQDDETDFTVGIATTEEKAQKMAEILSKVDGFENFEFNYFETETDVLVVNNKRIEF